MAVAGGWTGRGSGPGGAVEEPEAPLASPHASPAPHRSRPAGLDPPTRGQGLHLPRPAGDPPGSRGRAALQGPRHPAGVGGRVDHAPPQRPPPGGRHRRRRATAVPLPPALACQPGRGEVRPDHRLRQGDVQGPRAGAHRPRHRGHDPGAGVRGRRTAARPRLLPDRQRRLHRHQRLLRADDPAARARDQAPRQADLLLRRQVRGRALHRDRRRADHRGARRDARPAWWRGPPAGLEGRPSLARPRLRAGQRLRARGDGRRGHRQGLPHLARHGASRPRRWPTPTSRGRPRRRASGPSPRR